jgi:hypothetical protein
MRPPLLLALASLCLSVSCTEITNCPDAESSDPALCNSTSEVGSILDAEDEAATWSADGAAILYSKSDVAGLVIAERQASGGGLRIVGALPTSLGRNINVLRVVAGADGRGVFVVTRGALDPAPTLSVITPVGDPARPIMTVDATTSMVALRDGGLAFVTKGSLFVAPAGSALASLVASVCATVWTLSPDGGEVLCERPGGGGRVAVTLATGAQRSLSGQGGPVIWTEDGITAIEVDAETRIGPYAEPITLTWRRADGTVSAPSLTLREGSLGGLVALSADGRLLGLRADRIDQSSTPNFFVSTSTISEYRVIDSRTHREVAGFAHTYPTSPLSGTAMYFSPNGRQVAYFAPGFLLKWPGTLYVRSID